MPIKNHTSTLSVGKFKRSSQTHKNKCRSTNRRYQGGSGTPEQLTANDDKTPANKIANDQMHTKLNLDFSQPFNSARQPSDRNYTNPNKQYSNQNIHSFGLKQFASGNSHHTGSTGLTNMLRGGTSNLLDKKLKILYETYKEGSGSKVITSRTPESQNRN